MALIRCLANNQEVELIVFEKNLSINHAIDGLQLRKLENTVGEVATITAICYLINRFNSNFNVGKSLTQSQAALLASDIVEKYPYETIEDFVLLFKMVRQGTIGDGKDYKVDGQTVMTKWIPQYLDIKYSEFERQKKKEFGNTQKELDNDQHPVTLYYAKIRRQKEAKERDERMRVQIDNMVKLMDRQMLEDTITEWDKNPEMSRYMDYLKRRRLTVK